jgi:hypothetical protein
MFFLFRETLALKGLLCRLQLMLFFQKEEASLKNLQKFMNILKNYALGTKRFIYELFNYWKE